MAIALILQYMASGFGWAAQRMKVDYHALIGIGVLLAAATGHFPPLFLYGASGIKLVVALIFWVHHPVQAFVEHGKLDPWVATATKRLIGWAVVGLVALFVVILGPALINISESLG